jgi:hypothetical protein
MLATVVGAGEQRIFWFNAIGRMLRSKTAKSISMQPSSSKRVRSTQRASA